MSTQQKAIRDAIFTHLKAQLSGVVADSSFFRSPRREIADAEIPCVCVFSHNDRPANPEDDHAGRHERVYTVRVEVVANGRPEEDATDALAIAVRRAILADDSLTETGALALARRITWNGQFWNGDEGDPVQAITGLDFDCYYTWSPE